MHWTHIQSSICLLTYMESALKTHGKQYTWYTWWQQAHFRKASGFLYAFYIYHIVQPYCKLKLYFWSTFKEWTSIQYVNGWSMAPYTERKLVVKTRNAPVGYPSCECSIEKRIPMVTCAIKYSKRSSRSRNIPGCEHSQNQNYPVSLNPKSVVAWFKRNSDGHKHLNDTGNYLPLRNTKQIVIRNTKDHIYDNTTYIC